MTDAQNWDVENKINNFVEHYGDMKVSFLKEQLKHLIVSESSKPEQYSLEPGDFTWQQPPECVNPLLNAQFLHVVSIVSDWVKNNKYAHLIKGVSIRPSLPQRHLIYVDTDNMGIHFELERNVNELDMELAKDQSIIDFKFKCHLGYKSLDQ